MDIELTYGKEKKNFIKDWPLLLKKDELQYYYNRKYKLQTNSSPIKKKDRMVRADAPCWPEQVVINRKLAEIPWTKEQVRQLFKSFDKNGDGKLSKKELKAAFRKLGSRWSSFRARKALRYVDSNGDGDISKEELNDLVNYSLECGYKL
ncbi:probable calcium-binding protein CML41 [Argentina anserina]|uniref:probable calcium-binding protein CML41 n=1 Tax=Argentina anserina TaxID=57926 RepID=UPI00217695A0|nr:probable calcium-binding protein CML41 [Potentilla anserina]